MVERILPFRDAAYSGSNGFEAIFRAGAVRELGLVLNGTYTAGTPANLSYLAPSNLLGPLELVQNGTPRIKAEMAQLYHLSALYGGGYIHKSASVAAPTAAFSIAAKLPLSKMMDGAGIDATGSELLWRGTWRPEAYYAGTAPTTIATTTKFKPYAVTAEVVPAGGFMDPEFTSHTFDISSTSNQLTFQIDVGAGVFLPGLMIEALDASGGFGTDARAAVDGLIKRLTIEVNIPGESQVPVVKDASWAMLRNETCNRAGFSLDDETTSAGMVWIPFTQQRGGAKRNALFLPAKATITLTFDTQTTVEGQYTSVTPASGDVARVLAPRFLAIANQAINASTTALNKSRAQLGRRALGAGVNPGRVRQFAR